MKLKITFSLLLFSTLFANAQVVFEEQPVIDSSLYIQSPYGVVSGDFDADGDQDVLSSSYSGNRLVWLENLNGAATDLEIHVISTTIQAPWGVCAADLDGDGDLDVVAASLGGNNLSWFENTDGNGTFVFKQGMFSNLVNKVMAADMDNDGDLDLVWSSSSDSELRLIKNTDGLGTFGSTVTVDANPSGIPGFHLADINGDGAMDIVASYTGSSGINGVTWFRNNNNGLATFSTVIVISNAVNYVTSVYADDLDGDGDMDVVSASATDDKIAWYENTDGLGTFGAQQILSVTADNAAIVRIADLDGDGDKDVVFGSTADQKIGWFENLDGAGTFSGEIIIGSNSGSLRDLHFSDMNGDGHLDFLAPLAGNLITLFTNTDGNGSFTPTILTNYIDGGRVVRADDIDGDGDKDIVAASYWDDKISWYENIDGQGNFYNSHKIISNTVNGATSVAIGDIDGDGFKDVLATSYLDKQIIWYKNTNGLGAFGPAQVIETNLNNAYRGLLSDIDNDGDLDVFGLGYQRIGWYRNLGQGVFSSQLVIDSVGNTNMTAIDFGDLDGDGDLDISVTTSYGLYYYFNTDGQGTFGVKQIIIDYPFGCASLKIADFDNDGDNDIVYAGKNINTSDPAFLSWAENVNGLGTFQTHLITNVILTPKSLVVADFDADGDIDIASADSGNQGIIAWYENTDGQGGFENSQQIISLNVVAPNDLFTVDIDNNATIDIVAISESDKIVWFRNAVLPTSNSISGSVRFDLLNDGCTDTDPLLSGLLVVATGDTTTNATFTQDNGQFQIYTTEEGTITTRIASQTDYYSSNPANLVSNFTGLGNNDEVNFCVQPIGSLTDLVVSLYPTRLSVPGFNTTYCIVYKNVGLTLMSGAVTFEFDGSKLNFLSSSQAVSSQTENTLTYNFTGLYPFDTKVIYLEFNVLAPPITNNDDLLVSSASITPVANDASPEDNVFSYTQVVVGSFDPNDITCLEGDQVLIEDADEYLHYLIRFQNTGTAPAVNVRVDQVLDDKLDWTTMQLESLSHSGRVAINNGSDVSFIFNNINLPDSTNDEPNSHGFITYKIKPKNNVALGDIINASASIYFDFNLPIITNTAATEFVETLATGDFEVGKVSVYPNPTNGILTIASTSSIIEISLYNHLGQLVLSAKDTTSIDASSLRSGVYLLSIKDETGATVTKQISKR